ncbi:MAG: DUF1127 domain-containing protein [Marivita sp.]|uniref:DUF1127 domain-containing protein n=1 Tax=Marivita sp. TaxID=2003365 RepID=UPI0025BFD438|nr:DUF1127 domain-containing protein [Marivita sp.]MCI5111284.1 DUF1127 domain-containing protein [Marivita sp.]
MSTEPVHLQFVRPGLRHRIDLYFAAQGQGFNPATFIRSRLASILELDAMSDAELAQFGLTRADILPFVFEDCFADHPQFDA